MGGVLRGIRVMILIIKHETEKGRKKQQQGNLMSGTRKDKRGGQRNLGSVGGWGEEKGIQKRKLSKDLITFFEEREFPLHRAILKKD